MTSPKGLQEDFKRYLPGIIFIVGFLLLGLLGYFLISKTASNQAKTKTLDDQLTTLNSRLTILKSYSASKDEIVADKLLFDAILTSDPSVPVILTQVQSLAIDSGVTLGALQFASGVAASNLIGMQVSVSGSYDNVAAFLRNAENCGRLLSTTSLRLSSSSVGSAPASQPAAAQAVTATLSLTSPYYVKKAQGVTQAADLKGPAFVKLVQTLKNWHIYAPKVDNTGVGKSNPFQ